MQGCFSTEEIIPNRRKVCAGMLFPGRNHLNLQESLCRDAFPRKKSSLIAGKSEQGCFSTEEIILIRRKVCAGMLFHRKMHPCKTESKFQDAPAARTARAVRTTSGQSGQSGQSNQNNQRPERSERPERPERSERPERTEQPVPSENPAQPVTA